jgi:hypothetical protein
MNIYVIKSWRYIFMLLYVENNMEDMFESDPYSFLNILQIDVGRNFCWPAHSTQ